VSLDPVLMRRDWLEAYDFATKRGAQFLGEYARSASPFANVGTRTVSVQVTSVVRASDKSFQVKWTETAFERGSQAGSSRWTAILTTVTRPPASADVLRKNPLGIYIDAIDWSRELDTTPTSSPTARPAPQPAATLPMGSPLDHDLRAQTMMPVSPYPQEKNP
jgi:type IV secretion system protein TrbF